MTKELTKNQYWDLFQKLPSEMKAHILSEETATNIFDICDRNNIDIDTISQTASFIGQTLLGVLSPENLKQTLTQELSLGKEQAQKVNQEIQEIIFAPVKEDLEKIYSIKLAPSKIKKAGPIDNREIRETTNKKTLRKDSYRETIEEI
ncbi:MAG: hypothetical protein ABH967_01585 [Patescibacteria group bacterium]